MRRLLLYALLALTCAVALPQPVIAENLGPGGGTRVIVGDQVIGSYRLLVTSSPEPAYSGTVTFVVRASDPQTGAKLKDLTVDVTLTEPDSGATLTSPATHENAGNAIDYAAHVPIQQAATWDGVIRVRGAAGDSAEVQFVQRVLPARQLDTVLMVGIPFVLVLVTLGVLWLRRGGRSDAPDAADQA